jgi:hypothetical protein
LKYSFFTLKFEVDRKEEFLSWKNRVIRSNIIKIIMFRFKVYWHFVS